MTARQFNIVYQANESGLTKRLAVIYHVKGTVKMNRAIRYITRQHGKFVRDTLAIWMLINCHANVGLTMEREGVK